MKSSSAKIKPVNFLPQIESFRGLAACVVAVHHALSTFQSGGDPLLLNIDKMFNGYAAVLIFFVLSGYVLGLSLDSVALNHPLKSYLVYVVRRLFRIYPAYLFSLLLIIGYLVVFHQPKIYPAASGWFNQWYQSWPGWNQLFDILTFKNININNVAWTLRAEIICSCLLPPMHWVSRRLGLSGNFGVLILVIASSLLIKFLGFFYLFYLGLMVPLILRSSLFVAVSRTAWSTLALLACLWLVIQAGTRNWSLPELRLIPGFAAWFLVLFVVDDHNRILSRALHSPIAKFYGRISYSFYLLHFIVMYVIATISMRYLTTEAILGHPILMVLALLVLSFIVGTPLAWLSWRWVEMPGNRLGKQLGLRIGDR